MKWEAEDDCAGPVVKGGQGRSGKEVTSNALGCAVIVAFFCVGLAAGLMVALFR